jgi:membrane fusion protein, heavy metal efflux system
MKRSFLISYISFVTMLLASSCGSKKVSKKLEPTTATAAKAEEEHHDETNIVELNTTQYQTAGIETASLEQRALSGTIVASGMLDVPPQSLISISTPMSGILKNTDLLQGSRVRKGQVVVVMQHPDYIQMQQDYLEGKSQLEYLKAEYERQDELAKENINARKTFEQAQSNYHTMQAKMKGLEAKLKLINISLNELGKGNLQSTINLYSPIDGYVTEINTNIGAFIEPANVIMKIVNTEHLHAELTIFEKDVPRLKVGQKVRFQLANENRERTATVHLIGREISKDRAVQVHCHLDREDRELIPGLFLKAFIETSIASTDALPEEAIVNHEGKNYVFIENPVEEKNAKKGDEAGDKHYRFKMVQVNTGVREKGFIEILSAEESDLKKEKIVVKGVYSLLSQLKNSGIEDH